MIYAVANTKGGVGKTTVAVHLATLLAKQAPTLLIDADPQASAASWAAWRREAGRSPSPTTTSLIGKAILEEGKSLCKGFAHTVIDVGGRDSAGLRASLLLAQRAIIPVGASNLDAAAMTDLMEIVELAKEYNTGLDVRVLLMRVDTRTKDTGEMLDYLKEQGLNVLTARICERVAFRRAIGEGAIAKEIGKDASATVEVEAFFTEVAS